MRTNTFTSSVQPEEIDLTGLVTIPALYKKIIGAVESNIRKEGFGIDVLDKVGHTWALARCGIEFKFRPKLYSDITVAVWKGKEDALCYGRNVEIHDTNGELIGCGITDWCVLEKDSHRPVVSRLESSLEAHTVDCDPPSRIGVFEGGEQASSEVGYSDCDLNGHLNNCRYLERFFNLLPKTVLSYCGAIRLDMNFKREILMGSRVLASIKQISESRYDFCLQQDSGVACMASLLLL